MDQLEKIRFEHHLKYLQYLKNNEEDNEKIIQFKKKVEIMTYLANKYCNIFNQNKIEIAGRCINKFIRKHWLAIPCLNEESIVLIPGIYRFRINITNHHIYEYTENNIPDTKINTHRLLYQNNMKDLPKNILFRYCFDIRQLYPVRNQIIEIEDNFFFLQPDDHIKLNSIWFKVNGLTSASQIYLTKMEYFKSLSKDLKFVNNQNKKNITKEEIIKIIEDAEIESKNDQIESKNDQIELNQLDNLINELNIKYLKKNGFIK